jgi:hypothetical protein
VEQVAHDLRSELKVLEAKAAEAPRSLADSCLSKERKQLIEAHRANALGESELHSQLLRNLENAETRCRELDAQLLRKGMNSSQQSFEVEALSRSLAQERTQSQTLELALQQSRLESQLASQQHRLEQRALNEEERMRAKALVVNGEVQVELAAAEASAARKAAEVVALRSALEDKASAVRRLGGESSNDSFAVIFFKFVKLKFW